MGGWDRLLDATLGALTVAIPLLITAAAGCALYWLRVRVARLRAERQMLPPSSEPPRPSWWQSLRPRGGWQSLRPKRQHRRPPAELETPLELEPRAPDPELVNALEREADAARERDRVAGLLDDDEHTPPLRRRPR